MYSLSLDSPAAKGYLQRSLSLIEHLEQPQVHGWVNDGPAPTCEVAHLDRLLSDAPALDERRQPG